MIYSDMLSALIPRLDVGEQVAAVSSATSAKRQRDFDSVVPSNITDATGLSEEYQARHFAGTDRVRAASDLLPPSIGSSFTTPAFHSNTMFEAEGTTTMFNNNATIYPQPSDLAFTSTYPPNFGFMDDHSMQIPGSHDGPAQYQSDFECGLFSPYTVDMTMDPLPLE